MSEPTTQLAQLTSFATLGILSTAQDLIRVFLQSVEGADAELVAEETLTLVAVATARAVEVGVREAPAYQAALPTLIQVPFAYREYLVGVAMLAAQDATLLDGSETVLQGLQRKRDFYTVHLPPNQFPGERALADKMGLWMGRISPPRLPESPTVRLERLALVPMLLTHLRLMLAYTKRVVAAAA